MLYQLARAYETTGKPEQALATLDQHRRPLSADAADIDEVQFRRGELLFSAKRYREAADGLRRGHRAAVAASAFYTQALYKHGWSLFKQSLNEDSLPSFAGVLDQQLLARQRRGADAAAGTASGAPIANWSMTRCGS